MSLSAFVRIGLFGRDMTREVTQLERNFASWADAVRASFFGPWTVTDLRTAEYTAKPWDLVRCDPTGGAFSVLLPAPTGRAWLIVKNDSASTNTITLRPLDSAVTIDGAATKTITSARGVVVLAPGGPNSWIQVN